MLTSALIEKPLSLNSFKNLFICILLQYTNFSKKKLNMKKKIFTVLGLMNGTSMDGLIYL